MARAIHAKELMLQEKLWSVEEKIRQKIQRDTAARGDQKSEEQRHKRGQAERGNTQTQNRLSEQQRREPLRGREMKSRPEEPRQEDSTDSSLQLRPCKICNRKFASERLHKHVQVCEKVNQSHREVFNTYRNRTKGSAIEEFWKTHSKSPEVLKKNNHTRILHEGRLPAGTSQTKWSK
ncbi:zinc finger C2HC domain-containing protein 1C-like [Anoplopoma fimbria]|uniref:zinc finger C2HC domain-containing protein 1C-like n=1 Tax=Anoplopoma fimbria TaxID=229290 RepID=UPI0023ED10E9|nr:zinc finger C2HC domain-containing protein 1C-like [Anoplopoma fimbria]